MCVENLWLGESCRRNSPWRANKALVDGSVSSTVGTAHGVSSPNEAQPSTATSTGPVGAVGRGRCSRTSRTLHVGRRSLRRPRSVEPRLTLENSPDEPAADEYGVLSLFLRPCLSVRPATKRNCCGSADLDVEVSLSERGLATCASGRAFLRGQGVFPVEVEDKATASPPVLREEHVRQSLLAKARVVGAMAELANGGSGFQKDHWMPLNN
ncbi:hypothetical protein VUR80DRAFT_5917 [Thermomyces stellatus]